MASSLGVPTKIYICLGALSSDTFNLCFTLRVAAKFCIHSKQQVELHILIMRHLEKSSRQRGSELKV
jgi:hypothetical protein